MASVELSTPVTFLADGASRFDPYPSPDAMSRTVLLLQSSCKQISVYMFEGDLQLTGLEVGHEALAGCLELHIRISIGVQFSFATGCVFRLAQMPSAQLTPWSANRLCIRCRQSSAVRGPYRRSTACRLASRDLRVRGIRCRQVPKYTRKACWALHR